MLGIKFKHSASKASRLRCFLQHDHMMSMLSEVKKHIVIERLKETGIYNCNDSTVTF
ncbi:hypothetical protein D3C78_1646580 [compost metagenome]